MTTSPVLAMVAARWIVRKGLLSVPAPASLPVVATTQVRLIMSRSSSISTEGGLGAAAEAAATVRFDRFLRPRVNRPRLLPTAKRPGITLLLIGWRPLVERLFGHS